ncbi:BCL5p [Colletotrichum higginsianum]|uniref:BCL5p n=1 Tax=Colletotrichum higginsianum (strain IMI 349063) TaxID=759273 RepID=H1VW28_COLHI|nr:BCL5p [Colletotrichum higginsianum IMI 349063]OBR03089.1 BCL5p [Colletotrichum higginsianum IMI 349063]CCF44439.1 BCL5p [Colletotrichum higginsianum]
MEAVRRLLGLPPVGTAPRVDDDHVYPLHVLDDTKMHREIFLNWILVFDDVLDPGQLHRSLARLLELGDWRKIGGRLKLKEDGRLEVHVPQAFTAERPAIAYSHQSVDMDIKDHPIARTLPKVTENVSIQPGAPSFKSFAAPTPATLNEFLNKDIPQLSLRITSFQDATLVALSWPHTLMDVMGQEALLHAWSLVLADRESDVQPVIGAYKDVMTAAISGYNNEEFKLRNKVLRGFSLVKFVLRLVWDKIWNPALKTQTIFVPQRALTELRRQAQMDLCLEYGKPPFVSDGDILAAWLARAVASSLPRPRPMTLVHALNARTRLSSLDAPGVFMQNMVVAAHTLLSADGARGQLGQIALENRRHLMAQSTEGQVLAFLHEQLKDCESGGNPRMLLCTDPDAVLLTFTNWSQAKLFRAADFSPAVVHTAKTVLRGSNNAPGTITTHFVDVVTRSPVRMSWVGVLGKDHGDNYWLSGLLLPSVWAKIEDEIAKL